MADSKIEGSQGFLSRRGFIYLAAVSAVATLLPACEAWRSIGFTPEAKSKTSYITPNDEFYMVAVDTSFRPKVNPVNANRNWSLPVQNLNGKIASRLAFDELVTSASRIVPYTFECIGNPVGGQLIGNAHWHVTPLKEIIKKASGGSSNVRAVMFEGLDDFFSSVSVERVMDDYAFIAMKMNNEFLPPAHGFPARIILPDLYGMKQPRWLRSITLLEDADTTSYWEKRGWAGEVPIKTMARIDPKSDFKASQKQEELTGVAFAGARGIKKVEVSLDDGQTWQACQLVTANQVNAWSLWQYQWRNPSPGKYPVKVRATDGHGELQTSVEHGRFPDGASGYDEETIEVEA